MPENEIERMQQVINELAEQKLNLQMDLTLLAESYRLLELETEHFRSLATPEQRQLYRVLNQNK